MSQLVTITAPSTAVVSTADAKAHMKLSGSDHDSLIDALVSAATTRVERETGIRLAEQVVELRLDEFPVTRDTIPLQVSPVQSVDSVKYDDSDDAEQTLASSAYWEDLLSVPARLTIKNSWPSTKSDKPGAVRIRMTVGWADAAIGTVPEYIQFAIKALVTHWFINNQTPEDMPQGIRNLLWSNPERHFLL